MAKKPKKADLVREYKKQHGYNRGAERYGLTAEEVDTISRGIRNKGGDAVTLLEAKRISWTKTRHLVSYRGMQVEVIYDNKRHLVLTCLPLPLEEEQE